MVERVVEEMVLVKNEEEVVVGKVMMVIEVVGKA